MSCEVKRVTRSNANQHLFRQLARESCGEIFDVPDGDRIIFAHDRTQANKPLVGVACYTAAWRHLKEPTGPKFVDNFYHIITYIFVKAHCKGRGIGSQMLAFMEREMKSQARRPIRVQSAEKAVTFYLLHNYKETGEQVDCVCSGSPLFSRLVMMQKDIL